MFATTTTRGLVNVPLRRLAVTQSVSMRYTSTRTYSSTMHENDPEVLEREKIRNLKRGTIDLTSTPHEHAPGWNETLASASEAMIKADKCPVGDPQTLQQVTVNYLKKGRVETDVEASTTAYYSKDEVTGPLKNAKGKNGEDEVIVKHGKVLVDKESPKRIQKDQEEDAMMTRSEEDVKADRGEV